MSASRDSREPLASVAEHVQASVAGRDRELGLLLTAVAAGRDLLPEGPLGAGKPTLPRNMAPALSDFFAS